MKNLFFSIFCSALFAGTSLAQNDAVLMTIAGDKITVGEFLSVYKKNNYKESTSIDKKAIDTYLDMYVNFRLKVQEAREMGLDTSKAFKEELNGYRKQLSAPYLTDKDVNENLLKEAYDRMQWDVRASHILVKCAPDALPKDTLAAYQKIMKLRSRVLKEDFNKVAKEPGVSDDPSAKENGGDLGYFTAFSMVYPFETACYSTEVGKISMPVRTQYGYHIVKVIDKKPHSEILTAHIMLKTTKGMSAEDSLKAKQKIDEIYQKAKKNEDFGALAKQFSDDHGTQSKGGELPPLSLGASFPQEFKDAALALKNDGDVSEPLRTRFGWHIIKRISVKTPVTFEESKTDLKNKISKDLRSSKGREVLLAKIKKDYAFKEDVKALNAFYPLMDSSVFKGKWQAAKDAKLNKQMFNLQDKKFTQQDFAKYIESHQTQRPAIDFKIIVNTMYKNFVDESCIAYEETRLDIKYPEFKMLMDEYRDGILLFELTDKKVWSKAVKDTVGLKNYYENNKDKFMWDERLDATIYSCSDEKIAKIVRDMLKKKKTEKEVLAAVNKNSQLNVSAETKLFQKGDNPILDSWTPGVTASKTVNGKIVFADIRKIMKPEPKSFNDSKGLVTAEYQSAVEKEWMDSLKKKYTVQVNKDVLSGIK